MLSSQFDSYIRAGLIKPKPAKYRHTKYIYTLKYKSSDPVMDEWLRKEYETAQVDSIMKDGKEPPGSFHDFKKNLIPILQVAERTLSASSKLLTNYHTTLIKVF